MKENSSEYNKKLFFVLLISFCFIAAITAVKRIFFGLDNDEQYSLALAYRVARGDILFKEMWEPHQLSVLFLAILVKKYLVD